eukprot:7159287-Pyramimonas_sp.AAC.1
MTGWAEVNRATPRILWDTCACRREEAFIARGSPRLLKTLGTRIKPASAKRACGVVGLAQEV